MTAPTLPYNIMNGQAIDAVPVMANFNELLSLAPGTGAAAASSGANTDITSLAGLTTPLSILQGGNGGPNPSGSLLLSPSFRNLLDNCDFFVNQRNIAPGPVNGQYYADRWLLNNGATAVMTAGAASTNPAPGSTLNYLMTAGSAHTVAAGDFFGINQVIETYRAEHLGFGAAGAASLVLSFRARASMVGTFSAAIRTATATRSYVATFTITAANAWQTFAIAIPGDTGGTWSATATAGYLGVTFTAACGSTFTTATLNAWQTGNYVAASTQTQLVATAGATLAIDSPQLEVGIVPTAFEKIPYDQSLRTCQRYLPAFVCAGGADDLGTLLFNTTTGGTASVRFPVPCRAVPTGIYSSGAGSFSITTASAQNACTSFAFSSAGLVSGRLTASGASAIATAGQTGWLFGNAAGSTLCFTGAEL